MHRSGFEPLTARFVAGYSIQLSYRCMDAEIISYRHVFQQHLFLGCDKGLKMNFVIIGAGTVGAHLAKTLSNEEHNVIVIDKNPSALEHVGQIADVATYHASATDEGVLSSFVEMGAAILLAVSDSDETNLIACAMAKNLGYEKTFARIRNPSFFKQGYADCERLFFVDHMISAEGMIAHEIFKQMTQSDGSKVENFAGGAVQMRTLRLDENSREAYQKLSSLGVHDDILIALIYRSSQDRVIFPKGDDELLPGDEITLIGKMEVMLRMEGPFGLRPHSLRSAILAGGSGIAIHLAKLLNKNGIDLKVIEVSREKCQKLAAVLPEAKVLHGNPCDMAFLKEEGVAKSDAFVACDLEDEKNLISAGLAKEAGCHGVWSILSETGYAPIFRRLDIHFIPAEKINIANQILALTHKEHITAIASLYEEKARIVEMKMGRDALAAGLAVRELRGKLPEQCLIAFIQRGRDVQIAKGATVLLPGDTLIVLCDPQGLHHLANLLCTSR